MSYDSNTLLFDPNGRILQTEYAKDAIKKGGPVFAVKNDDGIIIVTARIRPINELQIVPTKKVFFVDNNICIAASGLLFDANILIDAAKKISSDYKSIFFTSIPIEKLCNELSNLIHQQTRSDKTRPVGVSLLVAGWDENLGMQLYTTDPDGSYFGWNAVAIGYNADESINKLSKLFDNENNKNKYVNNNISNNWLKIKKFARKYYSNNHENSDFQIPTNIIDENNKKNDETEKNKIDENIFFNDDNVENILFDAKKYWDLEVQVFSIFFFFIWIFIFFFIFLYFSKLIQCKIIQY
jgi:20S proteasome alpha/beta subunit